MKKDAGRRTLLKLCKKNQFIESTCNKIWYRKITRWVLFVAEDRLDASCVTTRMCAKKVWLRTNNAYKKREVKEVRWKKARIIKEEKSKSQVIALPAAAIRDLN